MSENVTQEGTAETRKPARIRKTRVGVVISDKMQKTLVVEVCTRVPHAAFKKIVKRTKRLYVHDEEQQAKTGDKVMVEETRPLSKTKCWKLVEVLKQ